MPRRSAESNKPVASDKLANTSPRSEDETQTSGSSHQHLRNLPNQLTVARLFLSVVFFILLALERHGTFPGERTGLVLNASMGVFILAVVTDFLDGYLARRWKLISTFGRIADPFADKIVICGGFVMLTGVSQLVEPWFAVVIMFREFLVSGLRSFLESRGVAFGAAWSGKVKMLTQSITIPVVLFYEANIAALPDPGGVATAFRWLTVGLLTVTLLVTVGSCFEYLQRAIKLLRGRDGED